MIIIFYISALSSALELQFGEEAFNCIEDSNESVITVIKLGTNNANVEVRVNLLTIAEFSEGSNSSLLEGYDPAECELLCSYAIII